MKRNPRKRPAQKPGPPTPDEIRLHIAHLVDAHQGEWRAELLTAPVPDWSRLLGLHLRLVELSRIEAVMGELF